MAPLSVEQIKNSAIKIIEKHPDGIRLKDIVSEIIEYSKETNENTIRGSISQLRAEERFSRSIDTSKWGLYKPKSVDESEDDSNKSSEDPEKEKNKIDEVSESKFYEPFAKFLEIDLQECTTAESIGGMTGGGKWGNPDVVGCHKPQPDHVFKFEPEVIAAEIKISTEKAHVFEGFGQASAYRIFSHKVYLVLPEKISSDLKNELSLLCDFHGLGLVLFDSENLNHPNWKVELKARKTSPNMILLNEFAEKIRKKDVNIFRRLFQ